MTNEQQIKEMVRQKYSMIALQDKQTNACSCLLVLRVGRVQHRGL